MASPRKYGDTEKRACVAFDIETKSIIVEAESVTQMYKLLGLKNKVHVSRAISTKSRRFSPLLNKTVAIRFKKPEL